jgi:hypothetical protein
MKANGFVRGRFVGGFLVLALIVASLVLANTLASSANVAEFRVQPAAVPTPPVVQPAERSAALALAAIPEPQPVPTPPGIQAHSSRQAGQPPALLLLGLSAVAAISLMSVRLWVNAPGETARHGARPTTTPCPECG